MDILGKVKFGTAYKSKCDNETYVLKVQSNQKEYDRMLQFDHPNILKAYNYFEENDN